VTRVFIASSGLGHVGRGFETLARELFDAVAPRDDIRATLVKGAGRPRRRERVARTPGRSSAVARRLGRMTNRDPYMVEQQAFALSCVPYIATERPDAIFISEFWAARALVLLRRAARFRFALVLSNGGPYPPGSYDWADHVHQPTEHELEAAVEQGLSRERQTFLPQGVEMERELRRPSPEARAKLRDRFGLPHDRPVLLSVAALNSHHKRIDYLAAEVSSLPEPRPHLVLLGEQEPETPAVLARVRERLRSAEYTVTSVPAAQVHEWYRAADVFVLASLWEAFGRVLIEAMSHGLPCVAQDGPTQRAVLGDRGFMGDLRERGGLARPLYAALESARDPAAAEGRHRFVHERYSWDRLAPQYVKMFRRCARR
jgi:glycosyltransferase involved in cell wall biosynthesis